MTKSEIRKIRKRIDEGLSNIRTVYGCYVNAEGVIVSTMAIPVLDMEMEEREMYSVLLRKAVSGPKEKHIMELAFDANQIKDSDEHRLLMALKESQLEDEEMRNVLFERIAETLKVPDKSYAILLAADTFDLHSRFSDEEISEESETRFGYFVCSICRVKDSKAMLKYMAKPQEFRGVSTGNILAVPFLGFMFPVLEDGQASIYDVMFYSKDPADNHEEFIRDMFRIANPPMSADMQKNAFNETLSQTLGADCNMDVITSVQARIASTLCEKGTECSIVTPEITIGEVSDVLRSKGISDTKIDTFEKAVETRFGTDTVATANLLSKDSFQITSSEAVITVSPENAVRIRTKVIDGVTYFLVPVGSDVKVNGVDITLLEENQKGALNA